MITRELKITRPSGRRIVTNWSLNYNYRSEPGAGYGFKCQPDGTIIQESLGPVGQESLDYCRNHPELFLPPEIVDYSHSWFQYAAGTCACGREVELSDPLWNGCDCGRWYNMSGSPVMAPHSGPYETGEYLPDIYNGRDEDY